MTWVKILLALLQIANFLFRYLQERGLIKAEDDRMVALALIEMKNRSTTLKAIDARYAKMADADVVKDIEKHGDFRD